MLIAGLWIAVAALALLFVGSGLAAIALERDSPPAGRFVRVGAARLHYCEATPHAGARATVVLVHGASGSQADLMLPLGARLAEAGFRVLAFDRPGLGWSDRPNGGADAAPLAQARLIREGSRRVGVDTAIVVGHSLGGAVAAEMALEYPEFVTGLVLLAPATHPWPGGVARHYAIAGTPVFGLWFARFFAIPVGFLAMRSVLRAIFDPMKPPRAYARRTGAALVLTPHRFRDNAQDVLALQDAVASLAPRLPSISAPVAILTGDRDRIVAPNIHSRAAAAAIPAATLTILPGIGHSVHWARPEAVVDAVCAVADRIAARPDAAAPIEATFPNR